MDMEERKQHILAAVVESYIQTGEPVGSIAVVQKLPKAFSSATIRNEMAALEKQGFLVQPHTSAGRVPTGAGYRFYIDHLMTKQSLSKKEAQEIGAALQVEASDLESLIEAFSQAIAQYTSFVTLSTLPAPNRAVILQAQAIKIRKRAVFVALVTSFGIVKNRSFKTDFELTDDDILVLNNFLNKNFCRIPVDELTPASVQTLLVSLGEYALLLSPVVFCVYQLARETTQNEILIEGQANLLAYSSAFAHPIHELMNLLSNEQELLNLIASSSEDTQILIGSETRYDEMEGSSVVLTKYKVGGKPIGTIGLIGPDRMNYARVVPHLEEFAHLLGSVISEYFE